MATADEYAQWIVSNADKKGTPEFDIVAQAYADSRKQPATVQAGSALNDIGRQVGLTARYGLEGLANTAQIGTEPIRYLTDRLTGSVGKTKPLGALASDFADSIGLPSPRGANERVIGDASRLLAGTAGTLGTGALASKATGLLGKAGEVLSQAPASQLASAVGSGLAGGASREAGGNTGQQVLSSVLGGLGGAGAASLGGYTATKATALKNAMMTPLQMDGKISGILQRTGVDYSQVPERIRQSMRSELADALRANQELNPEAVSRLLAFQQAGATPTRGMVSQNPVQITREQNLAKIGANTNDSGLQGLALLQNRNNNQLIGNLNALGANQGNIHGAGERVASSVLGTQAGLRSAEQSAWDAAKATPGYRQPISAQAISDINGALGDEALMPFMNPTISRYMEAFQKGQPFTPQAYKNLQSMLSSEMAKGGNEARAAGVAARILRDSDLQPSGFVNNGAPVTQGMAAGMRGADNAATESIDAVNQARRATRAAYAYEDSSPLVRSVLSEGATSDPQRIAQRFIVGGTAREAADLVQQVGPEGLPAIKNAVLSHLKDKAVNGVADETAKFSQSAFNKALRDVGERKLALLFTPEELRALQNNGRVAALIQSQPVGSAVNNSNSGALLLGKGMDFLKQVPFAGPMISPSLENMAINFRQRQAQNILPGLLATQEKPSFANSFIAPGVAVGGLLSAPMSN